MGLCGSKLDGGRRKYLPRRLPNEHFKRPWSMIRVIVGSHFGGHSLQKCGPLPGPPKCSTNGKCAQSISA